MFILDTNILTDLLKGHERVRSRLAAVSEDRVVATTAIACFEIVSGRYASVLKAADRAQLLTAVERLAHDESQLESLTILRITPEAADHFEQLRSNKKLKKIGRSDLLIACIALAHNATLVTRNTKDFVNIPGLKLENWAD